MVSLWSLVGSGVEGTMTSLLEDVIDAAGVSPAPLSGGVGVEGFVKYGDTVG
jgi:hypothetical protein